MRKAHTHRFACWPDGLLHCSVCGRVSRPRFRRTYSDRDQRPPSARPGAALPPGEGGTRDGRPRGS